MDHIHAFPNSPIVLPDIYYQGTSYDTNNIINHPDDLKSNVNEALRVGNESDSANLQTWLYFGLLNEVLGHVTHGLYIRSDAERRSILTTQQLSKDTKRWLESIKKLGNKTKRKEALLRASTCIQKVAEIVEKQPLCDKVGAILNSNFIFAVQVLGASLAYAVHHSARKNRIPDLFSLWPAKNAWISSKNVGDRLVSIRDRPFCEGDLPTYAAMCS